MKIWFDLTDIYDWQGHFTGIQRVVYNLAKHYHESDPSARFFIYRGGIFQQTSFQELELRLEEQRLIKQDEGLSAKSFKHKVGYVQHHSVLALKKKAVNSRAEPYLRASYDAARQSYRAVRRLRSGKSLQTGIRGSNIFSAGDTVLISGGNWLVKNYADDLIELKQSKQFKLVHLVMDMIALKNPALANPGAEKIIGSYFKKIFAAADSLIAISESTKDDIAEFIAKNGINNNPQLFTLYLGEDLAINRTDSFKKPPVNLPESFILSVGTMEIRKNYRLLYYVYKLASQNNVVLPHLVIAGRKGWMNEETRYMLKNDADLADKITILGDISDEELAWLYKNCQFTIFPSMYEGWGLPLAEAAHYGKICLASNISSMPEVLEGYGDYFSPYNTEECLNLIKKYAGDKELRKSKEKALAKRKPVLWENSYQQLLGVLHKISNS